MADENPLSTASIGSISPSAVWSLGQVIPGYDPAVWRRDFEGYLIRRSDYGNTSSEFGWQIDHINPLAFGGPDHGSNVRPRHWRRNQSAGGILGACIGLGIAPAGYQTGAALTAATGLGIPGSTGHRIHEDWIAEGASVVW
jgi:hypothetical protein